MDLFPRIELPAEKFPGGIFRTGVRYRHAALRRSFSRSDPIIVINLPGSALAFSFRRIRSEETANRIDGIIIHLLLQRPIKRKKSRGGSRDFFINNAITRLSRYFNSLERPERGSSATERFSADIFEKHFRKFRPGRKPYAFLRDFAVFEKQ